MTDRCEDCIEVKKMGFQIDGLEIVLQKQKLDIDGVQQVQQTKDIEHEQMIQNLTTRMDTMSQDFTDFKKEVKEDIQTVKTDVRKEIQSVKDDIPKLFEASINKLLARIAKYLLLGLFVIVAVIALAFTRPVILRGIDEMRHWVETIEVSN